MQAGGARHDAARNGVLALLRLGEQGHRRASRSPLTSQPLSTCTPLPESGGYRSIWGEADVEAVASC
jgi:hypothetical protein